MPSNFPLHRFEEHGKLTPAEIAAVTALANPPVRVDRHTIIRREGEPATTFWLLLDGWVMSAVVLPNGRRQILKVHLPGDVLGSPSMSSDQAVETLSTITSAVISEVPLERFGRLLAEHPRVAGYFLLSVQRERVALMDQLASIGRTSAEARVAAFLLDLADRLAPLDLVRHDGYSLFLTQEQIGDALGLTSVHVNRTLKALERQGLIVRDHNTMILRDRAELVRLAARPKRPFRRNLDWLPASQEVREHEVAEA